MNINTTRVVFVVIVLVVYTIAAQFAETRLQNSIVGAIAAITLLYAPLAKLYKHKPWVKRLNRFLLQIPLIAYAVPSEEANEQPRTYKPAILKGVTSQCRTRLDGIKSSDIFINDFEIKPVYIKSPTAEDTHEDWQVHLEKKRFCAITGEAGSGKSFELIKRVWVLCDALNTRKGDISTETIPLYVELGTLNKVLDDEWLENYVYKTYNLLHSEFDEKGIRIKRDWIRAFLKNKGEIVFFFDGIDEIPASCRSDSLRYIVALIAESSVTISCRKTEYKELTTFFLGINRIPDEYYIAPMSKQHMLEVIDRLEKKTQAEKTRMKRFITQKTKNIPFNEDEEAYAQEQDVTNPHSRSIVFALFVKVFGELPLEKKRELLHADLEQMLVILWEHYEDFAIKKVPENTDILGLRTYAVWIAKIVEGSAFYVESIQPNWLRSVKDGDQEHAPVLKGLYFLTIEGVTTCRKVS